MKCLSLFSWKNKKNISLLSSEFAHRVVKVKVNRYIWKFFTIFDKGGNFCDFLFAVLYTNPLLEKGLLLKERICSHREQIHSFYSRPFFRQEVKQFGKGVVYLESVSFPLKHF